MEQVKSYEEFASKQNELENLLHQYLKINNQLNDLTEIQLCENVIDNVKSINFEIAVIGSFKNGKSTFINALLGDKILPSYARPCTAIINEIRYGKNKSAVVYLNDNLTEKQISFLPDYIKNNINGYDPNVGIKIPFDKFIDIVTIPLYENLEEFQTPYSKIVIYYPANLLKNNIIITDTPGLNEIETRTRITTNHLRKADAIIMVFAADRICSRVEMDFIEEDLKNNSFLSPFFVINKMDTIYDEHEKEEIKELALLKLSSNTEKGDKNIFFVSSLEALENKKLFNKKQYKNSSFYDFEQQLCSYLVYEKGRVKLSHYAGLVCNRLNEHVLETTIVSKMNGLTSNLQDAVIRKFKIDKKLAKANEKKNRILKALNENIEIYINDLKGLVSSFNSTLINKTKIWVDDFEIETKLNQKTDIIQKEILEHVTKNIKKYSDSWYKEEYKEAFNLKIKQLDDLIKNDLGDFVILLKESYDGFFSDTRSLTIEPINSEIGLLFTKNIFKSLGITTVAGGVIELLTGLINPALAVIMAVSAIGVGIFSSNKTINVELKEKIKIEIEKKLKNNNFCKKIDDETKEAFNEYELSLRKELDLRYNNTKNQINSSLNILKQSKENIEIKKKELLKIKKDCNELLDKFESFIKHI